MDMLEALRRVEDAGGKLVARSRSWRGTGKYVAMDAGRWVEWTWGLMSVAAILPPPWDLFHEWEAVDRELIRQEIRDKTKVAE